MDFCIGGSKTVSTPSQVRILYGYIVFHERQPRFTNTDHDRRSRLPFVTVVYCGDEGELCFVAPDAYTSQTGLQVSGLFQCRLTAPRSLLTARHAIRHCVWFGHFLNSIFALIPINPLRVVLIILRFCMLCPYRSCLIQNANKSTLGQVFS